MWLCCTCNYELTICSAMQYVRCTNQKLSNIADCVIASAQKVDWLPPFNIYGGAETCSPPHAVLIIAGISNLVSIVVAVILNAQFWRDVIAWRIYRIESRNGSQHTGTAYEASTSKDPASVVTRMVQLEPIGPVESNSNYGSQSPEVSLFRA
jgi:hypothetical protein